MTNPIREAAGRLKGNWCKKPTDDKGNKCGMIHVADVLRETNDMADYHPAYRLMGEVANEQFPERTGPLPLSYIARSMSFAAFNDHLNTTEDEVIAVMEKAAVKYDESI